MENKEKEIIRYLKQLKASIKPEPALSQQSRERILAYIKDNPIEPKVSLSLRPVAVPLLVLFIFLAGLGTLYASRNALPGDFLYPVKRASEKLMISLAFKNKPILRAEILTNRVSEAKILAEKIEKLKDKTLEKKLIDVTKEIHQQINALSKDIISEQKEEIKEDVLFDKGSLPIQDGKKIVKIFRTDELTEKLEEELKKTKEYLTKKNLSAALKSTFVVREIISGSATSSTENVSSTKEKVLKKTEKKKINKKKFTSSINTIIRKDFGLDKLKKEPDIKTGLIRE